MKIYGPKFGYEKDKGAYVFAMSYNGNDESTRKELMASIAKAEEKHGVKMTIMGVGESVQGALRALAQNYIQPEWKVPHMQIHFGYPAGEIFERVEFPVVDTSKMLATKLAKKDSAPEVETGEPPASKPASPPPARKRKAKKVKSKKAKATPEVKNDGTIVIQSDLWEALKKLGG